MKKVVFFVLNLLLICLIFSCSGAEKNTEKYDSTNQNTTISDLIPKDDTYIFVSCLGAIEFFNAYKYSWKRAGEQLGVKTLYMGPPDLNVPAMIDSFKKAIAMKPRGIAVWAVDSRLIPLINEATNLGIPVVTVIGDLPESDRISYVGSDQYALGYTGGLGFAESIKGKGKVAILTLPGIAMFDEREKGFRDAFNLYREIEVTAVGDTKADSITAVLTAKRILARFPGLTGFVGTDSTSAMGAAVAVEEAGKTGIIGIVGMDRNSDVLEKIRSGVITATVAQGDVMTGFWALQVLINHNYYKPLLTINNAEAHANIDPAIIYIPANYVNAENVNLYLQANETYINY